MGDWFAAWLRARLSIRGIHRLLVGALATLWLGAGASIYFGVAPHLREDPVLPLFSAGINAGCAGFLLAALFWARSRIPSRPPTLTIEDYWRAARAPFDRFLSLLEGSATLAAAWTLMTQSWITAVVGLVSLAVMAFNGPERFEEIRPEF